MSTDWLIVGSGFTGAVLAERIASQLNQTVLIVEKRDHIGGNAFDEFDHHGILVHRYGPHIFHTNSLKVWNYLSQFTEWHPYYHRVLAIVEGRPIPIPFNLNSIEQLFPIRLAEQLQTKLISHFGFGTKIPILRMKEVSDSDIQFLADYVYQNIFYHYTTKQWGLKPEDLDASVTARVPIYISRDDRYFQDTYQAMPKHGYTRLFQRMLSHPNIRILLKTDYREISDMIKYHRMVYTGPIDEFFDYKYGKLPYRSLRFQFEHYQVAQYQPVGQMNYPNDYQYTRITEFKHLTGQQHHATTVAFEFPVEHRTGENEPYYPIPSSVNRELFAKYRAEADALPTTIFAGRLADYQYYNMDQAIARALKIFDTLRAAGTPIIINR
ncbi:UDP-galactopyranose mutase [Chloroflexus sp.]|uniref:UDP-galactopyranose mutase n=1 Tax=Chloroflexus sp. TaxID=1904827 RepID=UPI003D0DBAC1